MSELTKRILFAIPAAVIFLVVVWLGGLPFKLLLGILAVITLWEVHRIMNHAGTPDYFFLSLLIAAGLWLLAGIPAWIFIPLSILLLISILWAVFDRKTELADRWLSTLFCGIYAPVGFLMLVHIRNLGENTEGFLLTVALLLMIWGNDVFAYFGGKNFGKKPLAPSISPKKTWEGFWFGFLGAAVGLFIVWYSAESFPIPLVKVFPVIFLVSILGPAGDLLASRLKRIAGVKDSSGLLPGHGGLFDRFDALILSSPFVFFYFHFLM
ncbi:MAG: phosphatidate cytidylyltransferase [Balneolaceae bacterium]